MRSKNIIKNKKIILRMNVVLFLVSTLVILGSKYYVDCQVKLPVLYIKNSTDTVGYSKVTPLLRECYINFSEEKYYKKLKENIIKEYVENPHNTIRVKENLVRINLFYNRSLDYIDAHTENGIVPVVSDGWGDYYLDFSKFIGLQKITIRIGIHPSRNEDEVYMFEGYYVMVVDIGGKNGDVWY